MDSLPQKPERRGNVPARVRFHIIDIGRLRRYLAAVSGVAKHGAETSSAAETLAVKTVLETDLPRALAEFQEGR